MIGSHTTGCLVARWCQLKCVSGGPDRLVGRQSPRWPEGHNDVTDAESSDAEPAARDHDGEAVMAEELLRQADASARQLVGPGALLTELTQRMLERAPRLRWMTISGMRSVIGRERVGKLSQRPNLRDRVD